MCDSTKVRVLNKDNKERSPLLPDRHAQGDFFVCDIFDAAPKGDMASMEHPIFSLSTKPDTRVRQYENNGVKIEVKPSVDGLATVHDRDILIYCISQLINGMNEGRDPSPIVRFKAYDMLVATNRNTAGTGYSQLKAALERLAGTRISTNIVTGGKEIFRTFGIIEHAEVVRETRDGRMQEVEIKLSDWVFNAIQSKEVLTLHRDYFRLRKPLERRIYEIARKHCGTKQEWKIGLEKLKLKTGSNSTDREFKRLVLNIVTEDQKHDHFPDFSLNFDNAKDMIIFYNRQKHETSMVILPVQPLDPEIYTTAKALAPGWDIYYIEQEWRSWITVPPKNPEAAFLGFCKKWNETH